MDNIYRFSELNKESLSYLYTVLGRPAKEIGSIVGLTESAILLRLKKDGFSSKRCQNRKDVIIEYLGKNLEKKKRLTEDILREMYSKGMTDVDIGFIFGLTGEGVAYRRKKSGIKTTTSIDRRVAINHKNGIKDLSEISKEELKEELIFCRSVKKIARKYNSTFNSVKNLMQSYHLNIKDFYVLHYDLTDIQKKLIIGGLLGDGGVYQGTSGYYYKEGHSLAQIDYLEWKKNLFGDLVKDDLYFYTQISDLGLESYLVDFHTRRCAELAYYRDLFYISLNGKAVKIIPESVIYSMDPFILSIWYFDDGGLTDDGIPYICSGSPDEYVCRAAEIIDEIFDLKTEVKKRKSVNIIVLHNIDKFFELINQFIQPCFFYKVPNKYRFSYSSIRKDLRGLSEKIKEYTSLKWRDISSSEQEEWVNNIAKYYSHIGFPYFKVGSFKEFADELEKLKNIDIKRDVLDTKVFNKVNMVGSELASSYFPNMWAVKVRGKRSVFNNYEDSHKFKRVIRNTLKYRKILSDASIRSELRHGSTVHNFKPLIAKTIYDIYCPENSTIFDYSAGYGGRLVGAVTSSKVRKYIGTDPCQQTFFGLRKLSRRLKKFFPEKEIDLYPYCSEDSGWYSKIGVVDVCFSSPPYFDIEKYSEEDTQSYRKYPEINLWINNFLYKMIDNCNTILKDEGYFIINIANVRKYELQRKTFEKLSSIFSFESLYLIRMPSYFSSDKYEPIFVFKKSQNRVSVSYDNIIKDYGILFKEVIDKPSSFKVRRKINRKRIDFSGEDQEKAISYVKEVAKEGISLSRNIISASGFPFSISTIEREFGSWNGFIKKCGFEPQYQAHKPVAHVQDYLKTCKQEGQILSYYAYERLTGRPATRLKRIFNKGGHYYHLKEKLFQIALKSELWEDFLKEFK